MTNQPVPVVTDQDRDDEYTTVRRIVTEDEYRTAYDRAAATTQAVNITVPSVVLADVVRSVLAAAGLLTPPPEPDTDDGACTALFPDDEGVWWQCELDPHDSTDSHDAGDWGWSDGAPNAVPAQPPIEPTYWWCNSCGEEVDDEHTPCCIDGENEPSYDAPQ